MHNIPNTYPLFRRSERMASAIENTSRIDAWLLKRLSRMYEAGISLRNISEELIIDQKTAKRLPKLLGYASAD